MTFKPRKRFAHATLAAAATITLAMLACDMPLPLQSEAKSMTSEVAGGDAEEHLLFIEETDPRTNEAAGGDLEEAILFIDGVRVYEAAHVVFDTLSTDGIDRISVVKGETATADYGEDAAGGVINIYMKVTIRTPDSDSTGS